jgi:hypothetical protein
MPNYRLEELVEMGVVDIGITRPTASQPKSAGQAINTYLREDDVVRYAHMGGLNRFQEEAVRYYVKNQLVYDLGAGMLGWAKKLVEFGAEHVTAVDSIYRDQHENYLNDCRAWHKCAPVDVTIDSRTFSEFYLTGPEALHTEFIAWPCNTFGKTFGLELLTRKAKTVIYLGKNLDGTACGSPQFWQFMANRKVLCFLPSKRNSLIVYGPELKEPRALLLEEEAALGDPWSGIMESPADWPAL